MQRSCDNGPVFSKRACTEGVSHKQVDGLRDIAEARSRRSSSCVDTAGVDVEGDAAGPIRPRPKRLPQSRAVMLRKSPRMRPQYAAVGR